MKGVPSPTSFGRKCWNMMNRWQLFKKLEELGVDDNTIVIYTTDNGNELMMWPDGGYAPFRGEKGTTWEGGVRVPCSFDGQDTFLPDRDANGIQSHEDLFVTLAAAAGMPNLKNDLLEGKKIGRHDLQGPSRRIQQSRLLDRQDRINPPAGRISTTMRPT